VRIDYGTFTFSLEVRDVLILPSYKGSTLRGGFGNVFRKIVCALKKTDCADCILKEKCVYSYVFETPPPSGAKIMRKYTAAPHPFVIEPPQEKRRGYTPGNEIKFGLILIGRAVDYLPYFIYTFDELGKIGIGKAKGKFELKNVDCDGKTVYDSGSKTLKPFSPSFLNLESEILKPDTTGFECLTLHFLTPTRIVYDGRFVFELEFHMLVRQILRRIALLSYFHCGGDPSEIDFRGIIEKAKEVQVKERNLRWYDWERYSARQDTRMKMGGFVGEITFQGDIGPFMSLIKAGQLLHVGKGTSFGLGKYEIV
jgi:CRISPR-associated endoribonuclease Cas6